MARGLAESRARARALIEAGAVRVGGVLADKPARLVADEAAVTLDGEGPRWASRAALKLLHALDVFDLSPKGATALDLGASTGGFTDVLLARGATRVVALDVGRDQLIPRLRDDPRVTVIEGVNARDLSGAALPEFDWLTCDMSFISLEKALPDALVRAAPGAVLAALVKPQFEVGRAHIGKGGVVRDAAAQQAAVARIAAFLGGVGWKVTGRTESPIKGGDGNREWLLAARKSGATSLI